MAYKDRKDPLKVSPPLQHRNRCFGGQGWDQKIIFRFMSLFFKKESITRVTLQDAFLLMLFDRI